MENFNWKLNAKPYKIRKSNCNCDLETIKEKIKELEDKVKEYRKGE